MYIFYIHLCIHLYMQPDIFKSASLLHLGIGLNPKIS